MTKLNVDYLYCSDGVYNVNCDKILHKQTYTKFANKLNIITLAESLGGLKSLISCPYSMTHASVPKDEKMKLGITPNLLRLSVGIEHINDLISELDSAIEHN